MKEYVQQLFNRGRKENVEDVYLLPKKETYHLFFRKHEERILVEELSLEKGEQFIRHLKYLAHMDIAEKRRPQLGAFTIYLENEPYRFRLSSVGNYVGKESLVIRFFQKKRNTQTNYLFFHPNEFKKRTLTKGLYLFVGPTGSGKTTLMYELARDHCDFKQVITIEDPVELEEDQFLQLQTNEKAGITYETLIKLCLRHRPDCLMIGEIRDEKTAQMVLRASLTGHVIFATLHAKNEVEVFLRLEELGLSKRQSHEVLQMIFFQRLVLLNEQNKITCLVSTYPKTTWKKQLRKAWCYGFITEETYKREKV